MKSARLRDSGLVKKHGRFGEFIGCSNYPKCKYTRPITMGIKCPKCNEGEFVRRGSAGKGGRGRPRVFYGCSRYPDCDFTTPHMPIAEPCPKCGAPFIVEKRSKIGTVRTCLKEGCDLEILAPEAPARASSRRKKLFPSRQKSESSPQFHSGHTAFPHSYTHLNV